MEGTVIDLFGIIQLFFINMYKIHKTQTVSSTKDKQLGSKKFDLGFYFHHIEISVLTCSVMLKSKLFGYCIHVFSTFSVAQTSTLKNGQNKNLCNVIPK